MFQSERVIWTRPATHKDEDINHGNFSAVVTSKALILVLLACNGECNLGGVIKS